MTLNSDDGPEPSQNGQAADVEEYAGPEPITNGFSAAGRAGIKDLLMAEEGGGTYFNLAQILLTGSGNPAEYLARTEFTSLRDG